jgi:hypothetical protein
MKKIFTFWSAKDNEVIVVVAESVSEAWNFAKQNYNEDDGVI